METYTDEVITEEEQTAGLPQTGGKIPALVYVGPNLGKPLFLKRFQSFVGGKLPAHIQQVVDADADMQALFVSAHQLGKAKTDMKRSTSRLAKAYAAMDRKRFNSAKES